MIKSIFNIKSSLFPRECNNTNFQNTHIMFLVTKKEDEDNEK